MHNENGKPDLSGEVADSAWEGVKKWVTLLVVAALGSAGSWLLSVPYQLERQEERFEQRFADAVEQYEQRLAEADEENASLRAEVQQLSMQMQLLLIEKGIQPPEQAVSELLDDMRVPAWCKYWDADVQAFRMLHITPQYEYEYGVSLARYKHQTDAEIHGEEKAEAYFENDWSVFSAKSAITFDEPVNIRSGSSVERFRKFYHAIPNYQMVCGIQVSYQKPG